MIDLVAVAVLGLLAAGVAMAWRAVGRARNPRFERIERAGESVILPAGVLRGAYWAAQPVGRALAAAGVSANAITFASLPLAGLGAAAFAWERYGLGALFGALSFACDALDGLVARATGTASPAGEVLDAACDRIAEALLLGGLAVAWHESVPLLALVLVASLAAQQVTFASTKAEVYPSASHEVPRGLMRRAERAACLVGGAAASGFVEAVTSSGRGWAVAPLALSMGLIAVVGNASAVHRFAALARALRSRAEEARHAAE
ncbi:MAG TPA: CDP-alcohol phosphatidyltransferase family protein [Polyangiaceae bacterium]